MCFCHRVTHLQPCSKLSIKFQKVDIVEAYEILGETDDRGTQAGISVVLCCMVTDVSIEFEYLSGLMNTCVLVVEVSKTFIPTRHFFGMLYMIFLCPTFSPSIKAEIDLRMSDLLNETSSLLTKSVYVIFDTP